MNRHQSRIDEVFNSLYAEPLEMDNEDPDSVMTLIFNAAELRKEIARTVYLKQRVLKVLSAHPAPEAAEKNEFQIQKRVAVSAIIIAFTFVFVFILFLCTLFIFLSLFSIVFTTIPFTTSPTNSISKSQKCNK